MLSLQDSLRSSTKEGRIVPGWPMCLGETLLPWKSKDKKCCLYETPYIAALIWVLGDVIAKFSALRRTSYRCTYKSQIFFWFTSNKFLKRPVLSFQDSYVKFLPGGLQAKVVPERTTYCITSGVPQRVPSSVSASNSALTRCHEQNASGTLKIKMTARKGRWAINPDSRTSHPLRF